MVVALGAEEREIGDAIATVEYLRARDDSMDGGTARVLHQVLTGRISHTDPQGVREHLASADLVG